MIVMLAMLILYTLPGWAHESSHGAIPTVAADANTSPPAKDASVVKNTNHQPTDNAPVISKSSGPMTATDKIVARFMKLDTDMSTGVSFEEYMDMVKKRATARYATMDLNHDGEVTDTEYRKFWKSRMAQWYRLKR